MQKALILEIKLPTSWNSDLRDTTISFGYPKGYISSNSVLFEKDTVTGNITLRVTEGDGSVTEITIPGSGEFNF